jgi:hypothetical protein
MKYKIRALLVAAGVVVATAILPTASEAIVTSGSSEGFGLSAELSVLNVPLLVIPPTPLSQGTAPAAYNVANTVVSLGVSVTGVGSVNTGVLNSSVLSDVDGAAGPRFAYGDSSVDDLSIGLVPLVTGGNVVNLTATTIASGSISVGDYGTFGMLGVSTLENLAISVMGNQLTIPVDPAPNTVLFDLLGVRIVLNEQVESVSAGNVSQMTNAIHITLDDVAGLGGLVSGDVIIAHSASGMTAVPEPGTFVALGAGLLALAVSRRRR